MKKRTYAREITKEYLQKLGVEFVAEDGSKVIIKGKEKNFYNATSGNRIYKNVRLYDPDIRMSVPAEQRNVSTGTFYLGIHVLNYVWNNADKPAGLIIDHIDNNPLNNHISNLQCITPKENINKDKNRPPRVVQMPKYITEEEINEKLAYWADMYEKAKAAHDAKVAHSSRANLSIWRAKQRQFLENPEKYTKREGESESEDFEHECHARAVKRKKIRKSIDSARNFYKEALEHLGKKDPYTIRCRNEWKLAIAEYELFCIESKKANQEKKAVGK